MIRLKKIVQTNSRFVRASQLLALLYMDSSRFDEAEKEISRSLSIDRNNTLSLRYLQTIQNLTDPADSEKKGLFKRDEEPTRYVIDNELIIQPAGVREPRSGSMGTIFNIFIGLILGLAVMYFLVLPTRINAVRDEVKASIEELQTNLDRKNADIDKLQQDLNDVNNERLRLEEELGDYTGEQGTLADIDKLIDAANILVSTQDYEQVGDMLWEIKSSVDPSQLSESCSRLYDSLLAYVSPQLSERASSAALGAYYASNFEESGPLFEKAYFFNESNTDLIYFAAVSYEKSGDKEKAKKLYRYVIDTYPGTYIEGQSSIALNQLEGENG